MCMLMYFLIAKKNKLWEKNKHLGKKKNLRFPGSLLGI